MESQHRQTDLHVPSEPEEVRSPEARVPQTTHDLVSAVQSLCDARDLTTITAIVSNYARKMTGADGAAFVLRDGDRCYYADENAISPLWKGRKFPMTSCISGWVIRNHMPIAIEDVSTDSRIPQAAYEPTFVKSLAMVPIRHLSPVGTIGIYWAEIHTATLAELELLQSLANATSMALEKLELHAQLDDRTRALQRLQMELGRYAWIASHDFRQHLKVVTENLEGFMNSHTCEINPVENSLLTKAVTGAIELQKLVKGLVAHHQIAGTQAGFRLVNPVAILDEVLSLFQFQIEVAKAEIVKGELPEVRSTPTLLIQLFSNLIGNSLKFKSPQRHLTIEIGAKAQGSEWQFFVKDNGIGIPESQQKYLFEMFHKVHDGKEIEGHGLGLALCRKIVALHKGTISIESTRELGTTVFFTLPALVPGAEVENNLQRPEMYHEH